MRDIHFRIKSVWKTTKLVLWFVWRHAFTLCVFGMMVYALWGGKINWMHCLHLYLGAIALDWFKVGTGNGSTHAHDQMMEYARAQRDSKNFGSSAWMSDPLQAGSPAWSMNPYAVGSTAYYINQQNRY